MSGDEVVDVKEVGNDVDETLRINLNDEVVDKTVGNDVKGLVLCQETQESENGGVKTAGIGSGVDDMVDKTVVEAEVKSPDDTVDKTVGAEGPLLPQETQESAENGKMRRVEIDNGGDDMVDKVVVEVEERIPDGVVDKTVVEGEEQIPAEKIVGIPDVKSVEDIAREDDVQANVTSVSNVEVDDTGVHDEYFNVKLKSDAIVNDGAKEVIEDINAKENEERQADVSNEKSSPKENEESQAVVLNEKSPPAELEDNDKVKDDESGETLKEVETNADVTPLAHVKEEMSPTPATKSFLAELSSVDGYESGTEEEQTEFANDVKKFYRENNLEYKAPKFYKEDLNLLKLWRAVIKLGGYEQVTSCKLWRQVGESFRPPKTCTTVSWTFRIFYEKALLEYEKHKMRNGELPFSEDSLIEPVRVENQTPGSQIALGSGRARRDAAARAMQGWHSQRLLGNGEVCQPIIKDKNLNSTLKGDKQPKTNGLLKRKKPSSGDRGANVPHVKSMRLDSMVMDIGPPADWVKVNVQKTSDCYEIYALVPGLLREEVHVQSDPAGRLIISGEPEHPDNPWGVTAFKKVVTLPSRIDPHQTSAVVTLHGQLFVRVPFEQLDV